MNNQKGITLVALVVTIIVLIILAGVSISLVLGQDGIVQKAKQGRDNYAEAARLENDQLANIEAFTTNIGGLTSQTKTTIPEDPNKYTVRYASNNSDDGLPEEQSGIKGIPITLTDEPAERFGNIFIGWNTNPNATEATYFPGETYTFENDITLYPVFTLRLCLYNRGNECTDVTGGWTYEGVEQNGDGSKQTDSLYLGWKNSTASTDSHFKTNNNFAAGDYKLEINYKKTGIGSSSIREMWLTLYVNDTENRLPYKGTGTYTETVEISLNGEEPITIGNWSSYDYIYEVYLLAPDEIEDPINITYDTNGGRSGPARNSKGKRNDAKISILRPTKAGFLFAGWSTDPNATEVMYYSGEKYPISQDITLYAVWSKKIWIYNRGNEYTERTDGYIDGYSGKSTINKYSDRINISYNSTYTNSQLEVNSKTKIPKAPYKIYILCDNPNNIAEYNDIMNYIKSIEGNIAIIRMPSHSSRLFIGNKANTSVNIYEIYLVPADE